MNLLIGTLLSVVVGASFGDSQIVIGDQTSLHVEAKATQGEEVQLPAFTDGQVNDAILIVDSTDVKTAEQDGHVIWSRDYTVTSFSDSLIQVDPLAFTVSCDTILSAPLTLNVLQPFDKEKMAQTDSIFDIYDVDRIQPIRHMSFDWAKFLKKVGLCILIIGLIVAACFGLFWLWRRYGKRTKQEDPIEMELLRPCEDVALEKLEAIREEKAWQKGENKRYFSDLTYVIREYIGRRFDVQSNEKTSDDTLAAMRPILVQNEQRELYMQLEKMLRLADLVKFAKWQPTPDESEMALHSAYTFVNETKPAVAPEGPAAEEKKDEILGE